MTPSQPVVEYEARTSPAPGARTALVLLLTINLFNYIDRQVLAAVEKSIADDLLPGDKFAQTKMGWCASAFLISYMCLSPVFGRLANRFSRWALIAFGVAVWSLASGASGLATGFALLLITRAFVGVGEAAWGPVAPALIADLYPISMRGKVLAWFSAAIPVGSALGYALGGLMTHLHGWRSAFLVVVPPGLALAAWALFMKDPRSDQSKTAAALQSPIPLPKHSLKHDLLALLRNRSYVYDTAGMTCLTFSIGGIAFFMPRFIVSVRPDFGEAKVNLMFGGITVVAGLAATLAGGVLADRLRGRVRGSYFVVSAAGLGVGFPLFLATLFTPFPYAWGLLFLTVFALFFNTGPSNAILANVTAPGVRATAFAVNIFVIHALGDVISPILIGFIADQTSLRTAFVVTGFVFLVGAGAWVMGAPHLERDTAAAGQG